MAIGYLYSCPVVPGPGSACGRPPLASQQKLVAVDELWSEWVSILTVGQWADIVFGALVLLAAAFVFRLLARMLRD